MNLIQLVPIGELDSRLLDPLRAGLRSEFGVPCEVLGAGLLDPQSAFHPGRQQYFSTEILSLLQALRSLDTWRLLGVTALDLYVPILTFVFGEAQLEGFCGLVSTYRLRQEFYGLPPDFHLLQQRLLKEAVHELGHTLSLTHCEDYECVMAPSHAVEWIDLKGSRLCSECRRRVPPTAAR